MKKNLSILLIEDDSKICEEIQSYIDSLDDAQFIGVTDNTSEAIALVKNALPDAVILDLELHHESGDGLLFLSALKQLHLSKSPYILITTNNCNNITYERARQLGADFIMAKYPSDYLAQQLIESLRMLHEIIFFKLSEAPVSLETSDFPKHQKKHTVKRIQQELNLIGISPKVVGYQYLTDAILSTIIRPRNHLSRFLGEKYKKSDASIERAMQNAINRAWRTSDMEDLLTCYTAKISSEKGVPTLMEFIFYYAAKIKNDIV